MSNHNLKLYVMEKPAEDKKIHDKDVKKTQSN